MKFSTLAMMCNKDEANAALDYLFSAKSLVPIACIYLFSVVWAYWVFYVNTWYPNVLIALQFISFIPSTMSGIEFVKGALILKSKVLSED